MSANTTATGTPQVTPLKTYFTVFSILIFLTFVTVFISVGVDLGPMSLPAAMFVATLKATLVLLIFMHVLHEDKLIILILIVCAFFISLFFGMTMLDVSSRGLITEVENNQYYRETTGAGVVNEVPHHEAPAPALEQAPAADEAPAAE